MGFAPMSKKKNSEHREKEDMERSLEDMEAAGGEEDVNGPFKARRLSCGEGARTGARARAEPRPHCGRSFGLRRLMAKLSWAGYFSASSRKARAMSFD